jgi:hypothetical protein
MDRVILFEGSAERSGHLADVPVTLSDFHFLAVKRTSPECAAMSAFDPKRTCAVSDHRRATIARRVLDLTQKLLLVTRTYRFRAGARAGA